MNGLNKTITDQGIMDKMLKEFMNDFNHLEHAQYEYLKNWARSQMFMAWEDGNMFTDINIFRQYYLNFHFI